MPARPRGSARASSRRIPSTIRKMDKRVKAKTPPPPRISSRIRSNPPRRRSRTPPRPPRKPNIGSRSPLKRRISLSPKRGVPRKSRDDVRLPPKRLRESPPKNRKMPEKKYPEKPSYEGPGEKFIYDKEELKKITMSIPRDFPGGNKPINRTVVHPEEITIVRRPVDNRGDRDYVEMENGCYPRPSLMPSWPVHHVSGRGRDDQGAQIGEGSTPIFDRQELIENKRKYDDYDLGPSHSDRLHYEPSTSYENFRVRDYYTDKEDRNINNSRRSPRDYDFKPRDDRPREDLRYQPSMSMGRSRSFERPRDYPPERKDRYDDRDMLRGSRRPSLERERDLRRSLERDRGPRRSLERDRGPRRSIDRGPRRSLDRDRGMRRSLERDRGRSNERLMRRHPSPADSRRHLDQYRDYEDRRGRSLERRDAESHYRDQHDYPPGDRYSNSDHISKNRGYYDLNSRENPSPSRGRGSGFYSRGRGGGGPLRPFMEYIVRPEPPIRAIRGLSRGSVIVRRLPFPPRKSFRGSLQTRR